MSASQVLQYLYSLDTSSPNLSRYLYCLIQLDEEEKYLSGLQGSELYQVVEFLDRVRTLPPAFFPVTEQILQALDAIPPTDDVYRQGLHKLQAICGRNTTLPSSHNVSGDLVTLGDCPIANGGFADVWEGTHGGGKVCIKCPRVYKEDLKAITQVRVQH